MADIVSDPKTGAPMCTGCGERLSFLLRGLDSRLRGEPFGKEYAERGGTYAREVIRFRDQHQGCSPRPTITEVAESGITVTDQRRFSP